MMKLINRLRTDDHGATAIEYGLIVALIFLGCVGAIQSFGTGAIEIWEFIRDTVLNN